MKFGPLERVMVAGIIALANYSQMTPAALAFLPPHGPYLGPSEDGTCRQKELFNLQSSAKERIDAEVQIPSLSIKINHLEDPSRIQLDIDLSKFTPKEREVIERSISVSRLHALAQLLTRRGTLLAVLGDRGKAIEDLGEAVESDATYAPAYNNRACLKAANGDFDGAVMDATRAVSLAPNFAEAYDTRGAVYLAKKQYAAAQKDFDRAIATSPSYGEAFYHRSLLMKAIGQSNGSADDLKKAKELGF